MVSSSTSFLTHFLVYALVAACTTAQPGNVTIAPVAVPPSTLSPTSAPVLVAELTTLAPTPVPSSSPQPTKRPSSIPTSRPTATSYPTNIASPFPSYFPSDEPSSPPTPLPTFAVEIEGDAHFQQKFEVGNGQSFTDDEKETFINLYQSFTDEFAPPDDLQLIDRITTVCEIDNAFTSRPPDEVPTRRGLRHSSQPVIMTEGRRRLQSDALVVELHYSMRYTSSHVNVTEYASLFLTYLNENLDVVANQLRVLQLNVTVAREAGNIFPAGQPTIPPSQTPTVSFWPSSIPTPSPSASFPPTSGPSSFVPSTARPTLQGAGSSGGSSNTAGADGTGEAIAIVLAVVAVVLGLVMFVRNRKNKGGSSGGRDYSSNEEVNIEHMRPLDILSPEDVGNIYRTQQNEVSVADSQDFSDPTILSPSESLVSTQSLISAARSIEGESGDEVDATQNLAEEFHQYKDHDLEKMKAEAAASLPAFNALMKRALTEDLGEEEDNYAQGELLWGGSGEVLGTEVEASVLGEVSEWLRRKNDATGADKRKYMQETLNKMVASVRHGVLGPEDASRSIHECAALLGIPLANEIPVTTLIVSGMRKTVDASDVRTAFDHFGEIVEVAIASNSRGFGILRFKASTSIDLVMQKFHDEEIVVQNVAVQVKAIRADMTTSNDESPTKHSSGTA